MTTEYEQLVAHEAGHAAAALCLGLSVKGARVRQDGGSVVVGFNPRDQGEVRALLVSTLCGGIADRTPDWPPSPPLSTTPTTSDEADVARFARALNLNTKTYAAVVQDARAMLTRDDYRLLHTAISILLEQRHHLDHHDLDRVKTIVKQQPALPQKGTLRVAAKVRPVVTPRPPARRFVPVRLPQWTTT
jgi:hypothetical protein